MAAKKTKKKNSKTVDVILTILKQNLFPNVLKKISEKVHHEINLLTINIEHKAKRITNHFMNKLIQVTLMLVAFLFIVFGGLYFFIDIIGIERAYVLFGLGLILLIIVFVSNSKAKD